MIKTILTVAATATAAMMAMPATSGESTMSNGPLMMFERLRRSVSGEGGLPYCVTCPRRDFR